MKISVFGAGNMGGTIIKAVAAGKTHQLTVYDKDPAKAEAFRKFDNVCFADSVKSCLKDAELVFVCVKPAHIDGLLQEIRAVGLKPETLLISIAAGVRVERFTAILGDIPMVRTMPNLPAMVGEGLTGIYYHNMAGAEWQKKKEDVESLFALLGAIRVFPAETYIDKMIAVTSSSPAYVCLFIEALADGAVQLGFSRDDAYLMAEQAVLGSAKYLRDTGTHPAVMKDRVCSPAGTTIEAVVSLEETGLRHCVLEAMKKCDEKTRK